jgi:hypothetical protein
MEPNTVVKQQDNQGCSKALQEQSGLVTSETHSSVESNVNYKVEPDAKRLKAVVETLPVTAVTLMRSEVAAISKPAATAQPVTLPSELTSRCTDTLLSYFHEYLGI